ncbi:MAG: hypothetical protein NZ992_00735 [Candidatus Korarchaeum sp.]|nr:hypothetical protein [Candidatus Korarchaeum sp.]MDW8035522.1 hypothetical protein [Candidatus Korarchaeum sp.]
MYVECPARVKLMDLRSGRFECFELEAYHNYYAVYTNPRTGMRILVYVAICNNLPRC